MTGGVPREGSGISGERVARRIASLRSRLAGGAGWTSRHRYAVVSFVLVVLATRVALEQQWGVLLDIWEHAAVARELAFHPLHPHHPQLALPATPHVFFSPYLLAVGLFARFTGARAPVSLALFGVLNLVLFLVVFERVVAGLVGGRHVGFWALVFTLVVWGVDPWFFSSFLHLNVLFDMLPYPGTFSLVMTLVAFWAEIQLRRREDPRWAVLVVAAAAIVLLTHVIDAVFLYVGLAAIAVGVPSRRRNVADLGLVLGTGVAALLIAVAWPYFPFLEVFFGRASAPYRAGVALGNGDMYVRVLSRSFLALLGVPFVVARLQRTRLDPIGLMFVGAVATYLFGWWTRHYELGRLVSSIGFTLHVAMAHTRAEGAEEAAAAGATGRSLARWMRVSTVGLLLVGVYFVRPGVVRAVPEAAFLLPPSIRPEEQPRIQVSDLRFLSRFVADDDVVLADRETSWLIPAYSGKVVTVLHPVIFVADLDERALDATMFFEPYATDSFRRTVIDKYRCRWLLLRQRLRAAHSETFQALARYGEVVHATERYVLIRIASPSPHQGGTAGGEPGGRGPL